MSKHEVSVKNEELIKRGKVDHIKAGVENVVNAKSALFWQKNSNPIKTVKDNVSVLVKKGGVSGLKVDNKVTTGQKAKLMVTGALNLVPGVGSVTNLAMGVKKSIDDKNRAIKTEFNKGNMVQKTPLKSMAPTTPLNPNPKATTKSKPSMKIAPPSRSKDTKNK